MWLLSTKHAELHNFTSPRDIKEGYAILSHCWGEDEQSFQDVRKIAKKCRRSGRNPRDAMSDKIRRCCELAESYGYKWVWIDTCCIDKESSAELSEAINSMYLYYLLADICYVYLHDVRKAGHHHHVFESCKWITRGWTLQELLAPSHVMFVDRRWELMGTKNEYAEDLERCTGIPRPLLRDKTLMNTYSIAQRMSWAAGRETTRVEDRAYSLLGIFGIHMPTLYGEGTKAFRRLQEEILMRSADTTLFAWGRAIDYSDTRPDYDHEGGEYSHGSDSLFASSPDSFANCAGIKFSPPASKFLSPAFVDIGRRSLPSEIIPNHFPSQNLTSFTVTPHGVLAKIHFLQYHSATYVDLFWKYDYRDRLSPLRVDPGRLLLQVTETHDRSNQLGILFLVGSHSRGHHYRLVRLSESRYQRILAQNPEKSRRRTLYIADQPNRLLVPRYSQVLPQNPQTSRRTTRDLAVQSTGKSLVPVSRGVEPWNNSSSSSSRFTERAVGKSLVDVSGPSINFDASVQGHGISAKIRVRGATKFTLMLNDGLAMALSSRRSEVRVGKANAGRTRDSGVSATKEELCVAYQQRDSAGDRVLQWIHTKETFMILEGSERDERTRHRHRGTR